MPSPSGDDNGFHELFIAIFLQTLMRSENWLKFSDAIFRIEYECPMDKPQGILDRRGNFSAWMQMDGLDPGATVSL